MCGIAGANLSLEEKVDARLLSERLLLGIEERGFHATGAAFFSDGEPFVQKADMAATEFVEYLDIEPSVTNVILHTRWASKGSPKVHENNHPIDVRGIIGVHNGVIHNDNILFDRIGNDKRIAQVDSEAIFATLLHGREKAPQALGRLRGSAAIAWLDSYGDPDVMSLSRVASSPLVYAFSEAGSFVFASTETALTEAMTAAGMSIVGGPYSLDEGVYLRVRQGEIVTKIRYETAARPAVLTETERKALNLV